MVGPFAATGAHVQMRFPLELEVTMMKAIKIAAAVMAMPAIVLAQSAQQAPAAAPAQQTAKQPASTAAAPAQASPPAQPASGSAQKSLAQGLGMYVFPAQQQTKEVQDKDEYDCYQWAKQQSGVDPLVPAQPAQQQEPEKRRGGAVRGAAKGAAVGTAVGAIAGDTGKGAAIGAVVGGAGGASGQAQANKAEAQKQQQQAQQAAANTKNEFTKAFGACLKGKGYTVN
jgi:hypothetical protein